MKKDIVLNIKTKFENAQTIQELEDVLEEINEELVELDENSDAFKDLSKLSDKATKEVGELNDKVKDLNGQSGKLKGGMEALTGVTDLFGGAMGNLFTKLKSVGDGITRLSGGMKSAAVSTRGTNRALKLFKIALASTGIGLIVVALGSLVAYFTKTQRGADKVSKALAGLRAGVSVIVDRFSQLGEGLLQLFKGDFSGAADTFKNALSGITDEIKAETKAASSLEGQMQRLQDQENGLIVTNAKRRKQIAALRFEAEQNADNQKKAAAAIEKAMAIERALYKDRISIEQQRASIIRKQVALGESSREELAEAAQATARVIELESERDMALKGLQTRLNAFTRSQKSANEETEKAIEYQAKAAITTDANSLENQLKLQVDARVKQFELIENIIDKEQKAEQKKKNAIIKNDKEIADARRNVAMGMYTDLTDAAAMFFKDTEEGQRKAFEFNKAVQIADTIISTIASAQRAFQSAVKFGLPVGIAAAAAATASGLARVAAIKNQQFKSTSISSTSVGGGGGQTPTANVTPIIPTFSTENQEQKIKVFVTETDIRNSSERVSGIYNRAVVTE